MRDFASDSIAATSGPPWFATCPLLDCLRLVIASLLVVVAAGCSNGQEYDQAPTEISLQHATPLADDDQASSMVFPQHDASLGTDRGGEYFAGQLVLSEGFYRPVVARVIEPPCGPVDGLLSPLGLRVNHLLSVEQGPVG